MRPAGSTPMEAGAAARPAPNRDRMLEVGALFREYAGLVERILHRSGVAPRDVPDARQEVFLVAYRKLPEFEGRCRVSTWLCGIALRVASDFRRKAHHRRECMERDREAACGAFDREAACGAFDREAACGAFDREAACGAFDRGDAPEQRDQLAHALEALAQVAEPQREVFVLFELFELPMNEVAARVGCPLKTAFSRLYAARRQLDAELRKRGLLAGIGCSVFPLREPPTQRLPVPSSVASAAGTAPWLAMVVAAASLMLLAKGPEAVQVASLPRVSTTPPAVSAAVAPQPASAPRPDATLAALPARSAMARGRTQRRTAPPAGAASALAAAPSAVAPVLALEPSDDLLVIRVGAHAEAPAGDHPWAARLAPPVRPAPRLRVRGPADPADAIERALGP